MSSSELTSRQMLERLIGFPTVLLVLPLARKLALCLVKTDTN